MKIMHPFKFRLIHAVVQVGTILWCYRDRRLHHNKGKLDYKAIVTAKDKDSFTTDIKNSINPPLKWTKEYNFNCRIYKL